MKLIRFTLVMLCFLAFTQISNAQQEEIEKRIEKAEKLLAGNKAEEAEKQLIALAQKFPWSGKVWDKLTFAQLAVLEQKASLDGIFENATITTKDANGDETTSDSMSTSLAQLLQQIKPSARYKKHMINSFRLACSQSRYAYRPSMLTRIYLVDDMLNKNVKPAAMKEFNKAETEFGNKNYNSAAKYYQKAIDIDPDFYKARLYLGDVYYFTKNYGLAIEEFKSAIASQPQLLEPRKYLFDALVHSGAYKNAYAAGIETMKIYPDFTMMAKLEDAAKEAGIKLNIRWQPRDVLPNRVKEIKSESEDFALEMPKNSSWKYYQEAFDKVKSVCDTNGILKENDVTNEKYLEVYSWQYMLSKADTSQFKFARKIKEQGFLDCYVFINCFHYDFYEQYKAFVADNKERIDKYFEALGKLD